MGAVITATDQGGALLARTLSGSDGSYQLRLPKAGDYLLQVLRLGFRPTRIPITGIAADEFRPVVIVLTAQAIRLLPLNVSARSDCGIRGNDAELFVRVWEQARGALAAKHVSDEAGALDIRVLRVEGTEDRPGAISRGRDVVSKDRSPEVDSTQAREFISQRLFAMTQAETLAVHGYERLRPDGGVLYDAPSAAALLSDEFLVQHCFGIDRESPDHPDWIGISFRPISDEDSLADIEGTLWLSKATAELRRLEFDYTNLQYYPRKTCTAKGDHCIDSWKGNGYGGTMTFAYLPSGEWLVNHLSIRTPTALHQNRYIGVKRTQVGRTLEDCYRGPRCDQYLFPFVRTGVSSASIASITRDGVEIFRNDTTLAALSRIVAKQVGATKAHISGFVTDSSGHPLRRAVVRTDDPVRSAVTNDSGYFEIRALPAKPLGVSIRKPGFGYVSFDIPLVPDSTHRLRVSLVPTTPDK